ncbi:MAG: helix-turn-helix domain-containing protein [Tepidibacter sp.]|jgi:transcriptional regulator with XRE-family HTH domain|uniref:helix-turn-helix domain-containing protein n=1 Tax=Tepidibacter sp. TaxID=2529387 RepID=UPI0025D12BF1|nr:helix-turn-helix transcriptional regulator [Tepidibacter sp.]MCT4507907.1 helix-turn-helix domain-containing protein [Tepidibacter sp.]MCT4606882.1 helix-turn-helix domain-containing protein [Marinisporobacter sp.]
MIGAKIKSIRESKKMSQEELGKKVNINQTLISRIERGERCIKANEIILLAQALEVDISQLLQQESA